MLKTRHHPDYRDGVFLSRKILVEFFLQQLPTKKGAATIFNTTRVCVLFKVYGLKWPQEGEDPPHYNQIKSHKSSPKGSPVATLKFKLLCYQAVFLRTFWGSLSATTP